MKKIMVYIVFLMLSSSVAFGQAICEDEYGKCTLETDGSNECECADGTASASSSFGSDNEPIVPTIEECKAMLAETCTELPPDPQEECDSESLSFCEDLYDYAADCYPDAADPGDYELVMCCRDYVEYKQEMLDFMACINSTACDEWVGTCFEEEDIVSQDDIANDDDDDSSTSFNFGDIYGGLFGSDDDQGDLSNDEKESGDDDDDESIEQTDESDDDGCNANTGASALLFLIFGVKIIRRFR